MNAPKAKLDVVGSISGSSLTINGLQTLYGNLLPGADAKYALGSRHSASAPFMLPAPVPLPVP